MNLARKFKFLKKIFAIFIPLGFTFILSHYKFLGFLLKNWSYSLPKSLLSKNEASHFWHQGAENLDLSYWYQYKKLLKAKFFWCQYEKKKFYFISHLQKSLKSKWRPKFSVNFSEIKICVVSVWKKKVFLNKPPPKITKIKMAAKKSPQFCRN